jgi:hypothetical protein
VRELALGVHLHLRRARLEAPARRSSSPSRLCSIARFACARDSVGFSWIARRVTSRASSCRPMSPSTKPIR